jgi:hypothetical protein
MKIKLEVDVEASEMRELIGLPDVTGLQTDVLQAVRNKVVSAASSGDPLSLLKALVPPGLLSVADWQSMFTRALQEGVAEAEVKRQESGNRKSG